MILAVKTAICGPLEDEKTSIRLDSFLAQQFSEHSRNFFGGVIERGLVLVNGNPATKVSFKVQPGDTIQVSIPAPVPYNLSPQPVEFGVIAMHDDFIIINKPAGLVVHPPSEESTVITLVHGLMHRFSEFTAQANEQRPGIVHRLDKETSGLMIIARTLPAHAAFMQSFRDRIVTKRYLAIVNGNPPREGSIEFPIARCGSDPSRMTHRDRNGKSALTHYRVLNYYKEHALVEVHIVTGRTHQIRVHFAAIGHSVLGDGVYGSSSKLIKRQALHAWKISFTHKDRKYDFCCPVPKDMREAMRLLSTTR